MSYIQRIFKKEKKDAASVLAINLCCVSAVLLLCGCAGPTEADTRTRDAAQALTATEREIMFMTSENTTATITNGMTAIAVLGELEEEIGIENAAGEYAVKSVSTSTDGSETVYWLQQKYSGLEVYGHSLKMVTDKSETLQLVTGTYAEITDMDVSFLISPDEAERFAAAFIVTYKNTSENGITVRDNERVIYVADGMAFPAYAVSVSGAGTAGLKVMVSGRDGEILWKHSDEIIG